MRRNERTLADTAPQLIASRTRGLQLAEERAHRVDAALAGVTAAAAAGALVHICKEKKKKEEMKKKERKR